MPRISPAARLASSGVRASLMPPALPRPPTGTCALTATGPSLPHAEAAPSGVWATSPGGMAMPSEASTSLAWYSRSFISRGGVEWAIEVCAVVAVPAVAEGPLEVGAVQSEHGEADAEHENDHQRKTAADQDRRKRRDAAPGSCLRADRAPRGAVPILKAVVTYPAALRVLPRHRLSVLAQREAPVVARRPVALRIFEFHRTQQLEAQLPADRVRGRVVDRRKRMDGGAPGGGSSLLDGFRNRRRRDAATLIFGQDSPSHLEHGLALPLPLPEVHPSNRNTLRQQNDLENVRRVGIDGGHVATVALFQLLGSLGAAQVLRHLRRVEPHQQRHVAVCPGLELDHYRGSQLCGGGTPGMNPGFSSTKIMVTGGCCRATAGCAGAPCARRCGARG